MKLLFALTVVSAFCAIAYANGYQYNGIRYGASRYGAGRYGGNYATNSRNYGNNYRHSSYGNNYQNRYITCANLQDPANGDVKLSGKKVGSVATYSCDNGFSLVGASVSRKCQYNGKWSGSAPVCQRVDCGDLDNISNGGVSTSPDTRFGSTASYSCNAGHQLVGASRRQCRSDATWSGSEPRCVRVNCGSLSNINNGQVSISPDTRFGSTASYSCNAGHQLVGASRRQCRADATWSGSQPRCIRVNCGSLSNINNGQVSISPDTRFGSTASYSCSLGFQLAGASQRICRADASWSGSEPRCVRVDCGPLDSIANGQVRIRPDTRFQSTASYSCSLGFVLTGQSVRTCLASRVWSGQEPSCERIDCGPLPDIDNGRVSISPDTRFLSIATYTCNLGFVIDSVQKRRCEANGDYSGSEPSCVAVSCGNLPDLQNGRIILTGTEFSDTATHICNTGFKLVGDRLRRCRANGQWSSAAPTCVAIDCGTLPAPANGVVRFNPGTTFSSTASFQCKRGFILLGNKQRFCQASSQWSGSQPICQKIQCPKLSAPSYGKLSGSGNHPGDYVYFSCSYGYSIFGKSRITCLHTGVWSDHVPTCKKDYVQHDNKYGYGYDNNYGGYDGPKIDEYKHDDY